MLTSCVVVRSRVGIHDQKDVNGVASLKKVEKKGGSAFSKVFKSSFGFSIMSSFASVNPACLCKAVVNKRAFPLPHSFVVSGGKSGFPMTIRNMQRERDKKRFSFFCT